MLCLLLSRIRSTLGFELTTQPRLAANLDWTSSYQLWLDRLYFRTIH